MYVILITHPHIAHISQRYYHTLKYISIGGVMLSKPAEITASQAALLCFLAKSDNKIIFTRSKLGFKVINLGMQHAPSQ
jgi:Cft2 family RNA processing exonuclease